MDIEGPRVIEWPCATVSVSPRDCDARYIPFTPNATPYGNTIGIALLRLSVSVPSRALRRRAAIAALDCQAHTAPRLPGTAPGPSPRCWPTRTAVAKRKLVRLTATEMRAARARQDRARNRRARSGLRRARGGGRGQVGPSLLLTSSAGTPLRPTARHASAVHRCAVLCDAMSFVPEAGCGRLRGSTTHDGAKIPSTPSSGFSLAFRFLSRFPGGGSPLPYSNTVYWTSSLYMYSVTLHPDGELTFWGFVLSRSQVEWRRCRHKGRQARRGGRRGSAGQLHDRVIAASAPAV